MCTKRDEEKDDGYNMKSQETLPHPTLVYPLIHMQFVLSVRVIPSIHLAIWAHFQFLFRGLVDVHVSDPCVMTERTHWLIARHIEVHSSRRMNNKTHPRRWYTLMITMEEEEV